MLAAEIHPEICPFVEEIGISLGSEDIDILERVDIIAPSGCYKVELRPSFVSFVPVEGSGFSFQIDYNNIVYIHVLPKEKDALLHEPQVFVVLTLNSPVLVGLDLFPHIVFQMACSFLSTLPLIVDHYKGNTKSLAKDFKFGLLTREMILLSGASVASHEIFHSLEKDHAVRADVKGYEGFLYPLGDSLLFIPYPSRRIMYKEIAHVEFVWPPHSTAYFDLLVRMKNKQKFLFRRIGMEDRVNLSDFFWSRGLNYTDIRLSPWVIKRYLGSDSEDEAPPSKLD